MTIHIIRPSSQENPDLLVLSDLKDLNVSYNPVFLDKDYPYAASSPMERKGQLMRALQDEACEFIWAARGGYGAADLLDILEWENIRTSCSEKILVGFSDVSALQCAFYKKLGWKGVSGPMPATRQWPVVPQEQLLGILRSEVLSGSVSLVDQDVDIHDGVLFGGCFSVLTNLIGTDFFPNSLSQHILFFEDVSEPPQRLYRYLSQWHLSGAFRGVQAIVLGEFKDCGDRAEVLALFKQKSGLPVYSSTEFGHGDQNRALGIGTHSRIEGHTLRWWL